MLMMMSCIIIIVYEWLPLIHTGAAIIGGTLGTSPQHFGWGDAKVNVPPLIAHLVKKNSGHQTLLWLTPKCLLRWRIKRVLYYQNSISFQLQGGSDPLTRGCAPGPRWGLRPPTATIQKKSPQLDLYVAQQHVTFKLFTFLSTEENWEPKRMLLPCPVPMYTPTPVAMYSTPAPYPILVPVPIPVPCFIPTSRKTSKSIYKKIKVSYALDDAQCVILFVIKVLALVAVSKGTRAVKEILQFLTRDAGYEDCPVWWP